VSVTAERLMVEVQADVRQALAQLERVEDKAGKSQSRLKKMAGGMAASFGGAAIVGGVGKAISLAKSFDLTMRQIGVQTGQTGGDLSKLGDLAMKMGADTAFSAQDASNAMLELAKGGMSAADIKAGALKDTLTLAAAGGLDMGSAATYMTQSLNTFGLKANQGAQVAAALAGGANASTASVESLGMALSQVGPGAANAGMSIQETVAALAAFDNAGIKGSDAGTSLKTMLSSLVPATDKAAGAMEKYGLEFTNADGSFKSMSQVAQELKTGLGGLSAAQQTAALRTIFGSDATRAATVLMKEGKKGVEGYVKATKDQSTVQKMANTAMGGAEGAWNQLTGSVETLAIKLGMALLPAFTKGANAAAGFVNFLGGLGPKIRAAFSFGKEFLSGFVQPFKPALAIIVVAFKALVGAAKLVGAALAPLAGWASRNGKALGVAAGIVTAFFIPAMVTAATTATVTKVKVVASWVAQQAAAIKSAAMQTVSLVRMLPFYIQYAAVSTASGAKAAASWVMAQAAAVRGAAAQVAAMARVGASYVAMGAKAAASMAATVARTVAGWVLMGTQALLQAARMAAAWVIAMGPVGWAIAAAVAVAVAIWKNWDKIKAATQKVFSWVGSFVKKVWAGIKAVVTAYVNAVRAVITTVWNAIKAVVTGAVNAVKKVISTVWGWITGYIRLQVMLWKAVITTVWNGIKAVVGAAVNFVKNAIRGWAFIAGFIGNLFQKAKTLAGNALTGLVNFIKGIPGKVKAVFSNAGSWLLDAGKKIISGLLDGIGSMIGSVKDKLGELTGLIPDWKGPARKDRKLLRKAGRDIIQGLVKSFGDSFGDVKKKLGELTRFIQRNMEGKRERSWLRRIQATNDRAKRLYQQRVQARKDLEDALTKLDDLRSAKADFRNSVMEGFTSQANVLNAGNSATVIAQSLRDQVAKVERFAGMLQTLRSMGFSDAVVMQVASAGVEGGWQAAQALVAANSQEVSSINQSMASITSTANAQSKLLAGQMYDAGIQAAEGLVQGLRSKEDAITAAIKLMATNLAGALRKALGIHSPSRVTMGIGDMVGAGLAKGMKRSAKKVMKAAVVLADDATPRPPTAPPPGWGGPPPSMAGLTGGLRAGASVTFHFHTHNPVAEPQSRTTNKALDRAGSLGLV